ncbi:F0F1 ATP synthase subunit delta [Patescibacteria group bacterium]|nr:F0F1 ATP synthase subunit delta [Patescibacteria group bacterium]
MRYTPRHYAETYLELSKNQSPTGLIKLTKNFWQLVYRHKHFTWRDRIIKEVERLWNEHQNIKPIELTLGRPTTDKILESLSQELSKKLDKEVELKTVIKPHLLGGAILKIDDTRFDASLKGKLDKLYLNLSGQSNN